VNPVTSRWPPTAVLRAKQNIVAGPSDAATGELLRELIINPSRDYQPTKGKTELLNLHNAGSGVPMS